MDNIILTGLPGSGKTTLGQLLAQRRNLDFVDLDQWIEDKTALSVTRIFSGYGEDFFRQLESDALRRACGSRGSVIATGGGAVLNPDNIRHLRENGLVVFIDRPVDAILQSIHFNQRPLLKGGADALHNIALRRRDIYLDSAHLTLQNDGDIEKALEQLDVLTEAARLPPGFAVIGSPIGHTLSPPIHLAAFRALGVETPYGAVHVPKGCLPEFITGAKHVKLQGFNLTIPHKRDILPLLDEIHEDAALCGAVNTVLIREGRLHGYNTDMEGLLSALRSAGEEYRNRNILILGAGGAAVGIACKSARENAARVTILSRRRDQAEAVKIMARQAGSTPITTGGIEPETIAEAAKQTDILINATPLGMRGVTENFPNLSFLEALPGHALVCDLIYNPAQTSLLNRASALGLRTMNGLDMLIHQALLADELFLGIDIDKEQLYHTVLEAVKNNIGNMEAQQ